MYGILNNRAAPILKEQFTRSSELPENYNLRCRTDLILPNPKRDYLKKSFKYSGAKLWNSLSTEAKLTTSENAFITSINQYICECLVVFNGLTWVTPIFL